MGFQNCDRTVYGRKSRAVRSGVQARLTRCPEVERLPAGGYLNAGMHNGVRNGPDDTQISMGQWNCFHACLNKSKRLDELLSRELTRALGLRGLTQACLTIRSLLGLRLLRYESLHPLPPVHHDGPRILHLGSLVAADFRLSAQFRI